jgi:hypothetical protein
MEDGQQDLQKVESTILSQLSKSFLQTETSKILHHTDAGKLKL